MLYSIVAIFLILWLLGFSMHMGSPIHLLLVAAAAVIIVSLMRGRTRTS